MNFNPPLLPLYDTPSVEDPTKSPTVGIPRFNLIWYRFLQQLRQSLLTSPQAGVGVAKAGKVSINASSGIITTEALTTASGATYALTLVNNQINTQTNLMVTVSNGTNTQGTAIVSLVTVAAGSATITITNIGAIAFNGSLKLSVLVF